MEKSRNFWINVYANVQKMPYNRIWKQQGLKKQRNDFLGPRLFLGMGSLALVRMRCIPLTENQDGDPG